jgi:hypothetical protein
MISKKRSAAIFPRMPKKEELNVSRLSNLSTNGINSIIFVFVVPIGRPKYLKGKSQRVDIIIRDITRKHARLMEINCQNSGYREIMQSLLKD